MRYSSAQRELSTLAGFVHVFPKTMRNHILYKNSSCHCPIPLFTVPARVMGCPCECFRLKQRLPELKSLSVRWNRTTHPINPWVVPATLWTTSSPEPSIRSPQSQPQWRHSSMWGRALTDFPANSFRKQICCPRYVPHKYCRFLGEAVYLYLPRIAFELDIEPISMQWLTLVVEQTKRSLEWAGFKRK